MQRRESRVPLKGKSSKKCLKLTEFSYFSLSSFPLLVEWGKTLEKSTRKWDVLHIHTRPYQKSPLFLFYAQDDDIKIQKKSLKAFNAKHEALQHSKFEKWEGTSSTKRRSLCFIQPKVSRAGEQIYRDRLFHSPQQYLSSAFV